MISEARRLLSTRPNPIMSPPDSELGDRTGFPWTSSPPSARCRFLADLADSVEDVNWPLPFVPSDLTGASIRLVLEVQAPNPDGVEWTYGINFTLYPFRYGPHEWVLRLALPQ